MSNTNRKTTPEFSRYVSFILNNFSPKNEEEINIKKYIRLILTMAEKYVRHGVEYEDIVMCGLVGLVEATRQFDPKRSNNFEIYAITRIKGRMYEYCIKNTSSISIPMQINRTRVYVDRMTKILQQEYILFQLGLEPEDIITVWQHNSELLLNRYTIDKIRRIKSMVEKIAMHANTTYEEIVALTYKSKTTELPAEDQIIADTTDNENIMATNITAKEMTTKLRLHLGDKKASVFILHQQGVNNEDIADEIHSSGLTSRRVSRQAVRGLLKSAEKKTKDVDKR